MKQTIEGRKVQNWHRPLKTDELRARYRRLRHKDTTKNDRGPYDPAGDDLTDPWDPVGDPFYSGYRYESGLDDLEGPFGDLQRHLLGNPLQDALVACAEHLQARAGSVVGDAERAVHAQGRLERLLPDLAYWIATDEFSEDLSAAIRESADMPEEIAVVRKHVGGCPSPHLGEKLMLLSPFWTRSPLTFAGDTSDELVNHLFVRYAVPDSLRGAWKSSASQPDGLTWMMWFVLLGGGGNVRRAARSLGFTVARGYIEQWFAAPGDMNPAAAAMYAEVKRLGGEEVDFVRLTRHRDFVMNPLDTMQGRDPRAAEHRRFWHGTAIWLIAHRDELSDRDCPDILCWALHMHTEALCLNDAFSWKGRSPRAVIERSAEYRESIHFRRRPTTNARWPCRGWDLELSVTDDTAWSFRELTSSVELWEEGRAMDHCVGSYDNRCVRGLAAIVSVRRGAERCLTLEISPETLRVVQARGAGNRLMSLEERAVVRTWLTSVVALAHARPLAPSAPSVKS